MSDRAVLFKAKAISAFEVMDSDNIPLDVGDIVYVYNNSDPDWWEGKKESDGSVGYFPANHTAIIEEETQQEGQTARRPAPPGPPKFPPANVSSKPVAINISKPPGPPGPPPIESKTLESKQQPRVNLTTASTTTAVKTPDIAVKAGPANFNFNYEPPKELKTRFGAWASNMTIISAYTSFMMGICTLAWAIIDINIDQNLFPADGVLTPVIGVYQILLAIWLFIFERKFGESRSGTKFPLRAILCWLYASFCCLTRPAIITASFLFVAGIINFIAAALGEEYAAPAAAQVAAAAASPAAAAEKKGICARIHEWAVETKEQNRVGVLVFMTLYIGANIAVFVHTVIVWYDMNNSLAPQNRLSGWGPFAKGFGVSLDLNCALIVLPVSRTVLRWIYNHSTRGENCTSKAFRALLEFIPIDKNIAFHKMLANAIVVGVAGHTIIHFINFAHRPSQTRAIFTDWPWYSGGIIMLVMLVMYSSARDNTKRGHFEVFWYSHHGFILFFVILLTHGRNGWNPNFWKWFVGPGAIYLIERLLRVYRASQEVVVTSVTLMKPDVFSLEFAKKGVLESPYSEGQYLFLNCPNVSYIQWHPFTISSAPHEPTVTVHIRLCGPGSWTQDVAAYMGSLGTKTYFKLERQDATGKVLGKILGPDGKQMLCIDGPHSAPTQHIGEYTCCMIVGAGIGVTPVSSTLKSIVYHRWKFDSGECYPGHAHFVWVCSYKDISAFRWLIKVVKDAQDWVCHLRKTSASSMSKKSFEFHIYLTSVPKDLKKSPVPPVDDEVGFWGVPYHGDSQTEIMQTRADFSVMDLYMQMLNPPEKHAQLGDVHVWTGRPNWDARFSAMNTQFPDRAIGVAFCGNPMIGKDLRAMCFKYNRGRQQLFKLHKENF